MIFILYSLSLLFALIGFVFMMIYVMFRKKFKNRFVVTVVSALYIPLFFLFANIPYVIEKRVGYGGFWYTFGGYFFYYGFIVFCLLKNRSKIKKAVGEWKFR